MGTPVSAAGVTAVPRCLEAWGHCTSSHRPRAEGDDLFLEMFTQFLSLQRGWGVCLRAGPPALPRCRGQRAGAPHLLSPGSRGTSTPTASSPMTRGCSPCRWVQGGCTPGPGRCLGAGRGQDAAVEGPGCSSPSSVRCQQPVVCFLYELQDAGASQPLLLLGAVGGCLPTAQRILTLSLPATEPVTACPHGVCPGLASPPRCPLRVSPGPQPSAAALPAP